MSTTQQGSCDTGRGRGNRGDRATRRTWSPREEAVLLAALKELVAQGGKSDNGFRPRYLSRLEEALAKEFPGTDLKGMPHINSKLQIWKKNYYSLSLILGRSDVGFNANHVLEVDNDQWEQICKIDANARGMRHKSWPMYDAWQEIFGKDRATGENAEDIMDAVNAMVQEDSRAEGYVPIVELDANLDDTSGGDMGENSVCHDEKGETVDKNQNKPKKRKANTFTDGGVAEVLREISRGTNERLDKIASRLGYEFDLDQAKKDVFSLLEHITGLTLDDKFDLCDIFADKHERLMTFQGLPEDARKQYVLRLLKSKQQ